MVMVVIVVLGMIVFAFDDGGCGFNETLLHILLGVTVSSSARVVFIISPDQEDLQPSFLLSVI